MSLVEACLELRQDFQGPLHRIKATFPTGPKNELRWHDGFVFDHNQLEREEGEVVEYQYTLFFPINATDIMKLFPHPPPLVPPRQVALLGEKSEKMRHHSFTRSVPASRVAGASENFVHGENSILEEALHELEHTF